MLRATLRSLLARKLRLLLSGLAIVLGVSFTAGAFTLTDSLGKTFDDLFADLGQNTDALVRSQSDIGDGVDAVRTPLPADLLTRLRTTPGVAAAEGSVTSYAQVVKKDGKAYSPGMAPSLGVNYDDEPALSPLTLRKGVQPKGPDQIALDATTARKTGYTVGDKVRVVYQGGDRSFTVAGVFGVGESDGFAGASVIAFDTPTAQSLLGEPGTFDSLVFKASPGTSQAQLVQALSPELPRGIEAITGEQSNDETTDSFDQILKVFNIFLLVFAGISLFVGGFLIFNTFTILVAQRTRELALLRALGASRKQVNRSVLVEAGVVGLVASVVGLGVGIGIAAGLKSLAGDNLPEAALLVEPRTVVVSIVLGVVITVLAALLPARRASRIAPIAAMREAETSDIPLRRRTLIGLVVLGIGIAGTVLGLTASTQWLIVGGIGLFVGMVALAPQLARPVISVVGKPFDRRTPGRLGRLNAARNPRRTSSTAVALMIGLALVTGVSILGASLKSSIESTVSTSLTADVIVQQTGSGMAGIPNNVAPVVADLPQVGGTDVLRSSAVSINGDDHFVTAVTTGALGRAFVLDNVAGDISKLGPGTFVMSVDEAESEGLRPGESVTVKGPKGTEQVRLVGTYEENELAGSWLFDLSIARTFNVSLTGALLLTPAEGVSTAALQDAVNKATSAFPTVEAVTRQEFTDQIADQVNGFINFITVLLVLSVIIAILGIVNTLALAVFERTREIGLLRAVGLGRRQTRSMIRVEAVLVSVFGALLGIVVGTVLGVAAQQALKDDGVSELALPYGRVVVFVLLAALAGVLAALAPARRAARMDVLGAIATT